MKPKQAITGIVFGDVHWTDTPPMSRSANYLADLSSILEQIGAIARTMKVDFVACTGDWFHSKGNTSNRAVCRLIECLQTNFDRPILTIPGNHDMIGDNVDSIKDGQPFHLLELAGVVRRVDVDMS